MYKENETADTKVEDVDLNKALVGKVYSIDYYQRDYAWGEKEVFELLEDLYIKFKESYNVDDSPMDTKKYKQYFLGSFVVSRKDNIDYIIDGQQRLTTLTLLFLGIYHVSKSKGKEIQKSKEFIVSEFDDNEFNIKVKDRIPVMKYLLSGQEDNNYEKNNLLIKNYKIIYNFLDQVFNKDDLLVFYSWISQRVLMVKITAYNDNEAYTIFEAMNDRGKSLNNLDMLKGYLLSLVESKNLEYATDLWKKISNKFNSNDEFDKFIISLFRAKYARSTALSVSNRRKNGIKIQNDWTRISNYYHRFIKENRFTPIVNLQDSEDIVKLLSDIDYYSDMYLKLQNYKENFNKDYEYVYYLNKLNIAHMDIMFYALINPHDKDEEIKIKAISRFLDIRAALYSWNNLDGMSETNLADYFIRLLKRIKQVDEWEDITVLSYILYKELKKENKLGHSISNINYPQYKNSTIYKKQIFHLLARISAFFDVDNNSEALTTFYKEKYEIEHILTKTYDKNSEWYNDEDDLNNKRNFIGALGLLPKTVNNSFNNKSYLEKKEKYTSQNSYLASLNDSFFNENNNTVQNKPQLNKILSNNENIKKLFKPHKEFRKEDIESRNLLALEVSKTIWDINTMSIYSTEDFEELEEIIEYDDTISENNELDNQTKEYVIGQKLSYQIDNTKLTGTYQGNSKLLLNTVENAPIIPAKNRINKTFARIYKEIITDPKVNINDSDFTYSWEGNIKNCPIKTLIYLAHGKMIGGSITLDEIEAIL